MTDATCYRLLTYATTTGPRAGLLVSDKVIDLEAAVESHAGAHRVKSRFTGASVKETLQEWDEARAMLRAIAGEAREGKLAGVRQRPLAETKLLAPILYPGALFGATANYTDHLREMKMGDAPDKNVTRPCFFLKTTEHSIIGSGEPAHLRPVAADGVLGRRAWRRDRQARPQR